MHDLFRFVVLVECYDSCTVCTCRFTGGNIHARVLKSKLFFSFFVLSELRKKLKEEVTAVRNEHEGFKPGLAIVQVYSVNYCEAFHA